jgi:hypothetical protein
MRFGPIPVMACGVLVALGGCGSDAPVALPASGTAYRALSSDARSKVAASCRDHAAEHARGTAARQLRAVDPDVLREQLDDAFTFVADQRRPVAQLCAERLPYVTPGLRVRFAGAKGDGAGRFAYETTSDRPLTIRGRISPPPRGGRVVARREVGRPSRFAAAIAPDGRFAIGPIRLRKIADNTFTVAIDAPPNAAHEVHFSAICLDCIAGTPAARRP